MTKQEQIEEMAKCICNVCDWMEASGCMKGDIDNYTQCSRTMKTANALYDAGYRYREIREKDETLEERKGLKAEIKHLNTIAERLDELLWKGIDEYIKGIDGVEGLKDMWEHSAVREFAEKLKARINADYVNGCLNNHKGYLIEYDINEELKEYE